MTKNGKPKCNLYSILKILNDTACHELPLGII
jgi:hypothetical protein